MSNNISITITREELNKMVAEAVAAAMSSGAPNKAKAKASRKPRPEDYPKTIPSVYILWGQLYRAQRKLEEDDNEFKVPKDELKEQWAIAKEKQTKLYIEATAKYNKSKAVWDAERDQYYTAHGLPAPKKSPKKIAEMLAMSDDDEEDEEVEKKPKKAKKASKKSA